MFSRRGLIALLSLWLQITYAESPWLSADFLAIYHYKKNLLSGWHSRIQNPEFFFARDGHTNPKAEWQAGLEAFRSTAKTFGVQKQSALCVFPARRLVFERLSGVKFPTKKCPDLENWLERLDAKSAHLVFVGAFAGNPASLLGHAFLRLSRASTTHRPEARDEVEQDLLSYSAGFLANPDPRDSRAEVIAKGLTGAYPGLFEVEPHYMKVGLYNNSESRDLWDWPILFSTEEVRFLTLSLYERLFNAQMKYYFIDENCAYWLAALLEAVRPNLHLAERLPLIVLPMDLVRELEEQALLDSSEFYRPSEGRQIERKFAKLEANQKEILNLALKDPREIKKVSDPQVLDLAADLWKMKNYRLRTQLSASESEKMKLTLEQLAGLGKPVQYSATGDEMKRVYKIQSPREAHASRSVAADNERIDLLLGAHSSWHPQDGYDHVDNIEYLGLSWLRPQTRDRSLEFLIAHVQSLEDYSFPDFPWSWDFAFRWRETCRLCEGKSGLDNSATMGLAKQFNEIKIYSLLGLRFALWRNEDWQGEWGPDLRLGSRWHRGPHQIVIEGEWHKHKWGDWLESQFLYGWRLNRDFSLYSRLDFAKWTSESRQAHMALGGVWFF